ncbi:MAG: hypothetical protein AAFW70_12755 [Cyanobacteria bacterium J06635_10]
MYQKKIKLKTRKRQRIRRFPGKSREGRRHKSEATTKRTNSLRFAPSYFCLLIKSVSIIGITVASINLIAFNSSFAATSDISDNNAVAQTQGTTFNKNSSDEIQGFIDDVRSFVRGDFFGNIKQLVQNSIGSVDIPDLGQVVSEIMKGSLPQDGVTSNKLENNLPNSYAIRQDLANQSERVGAVEVSQSKTLSKNAQQQSLKTLELSASSEIESSQMSDDSQKTDTSQQILQNISQQLKNNAAIANLQYKEASQARHDRALGLNLTAQVAQELNAANIGDRQTQISTGNRAVSQGSLLMMPGGAVLGRVRE